MSSSALCLSSLCRRSTYTLRTLSASSFFRRPCFGLLFHRPAPLTAFLCAFTSRHTRLPRLSSPSRLPHLRGTGMLPGNTTSRAKIHGDFNTFNSFIIRFAPTSRAGNASDMLHFSSLFFSLYLTAVRLSCCSCSCSLRRLENGCIDGIRVR